MTFKNVDYCLHGTKEGGRERVREREGEREPDGEKSTQAEEREASKDHPIGEGLG